MVGEIHGELIHGNWLIDSLNIDPISISVQSALELSACYRTLSGSEGIENSTWRRGQYHLR